MIPEFCLESLEKGDYVEGLGKDRIIMLQLFLWKQNERTPSVFVWLRIGINGGFL